MAPGGGGGGGLNHTQMCVSKMDGKEYFFRLQVAKMNEMLSFKENGGGGDYFNLNHTQMCVTKMEGNGSNFAMK